MPPCTTINKPFKSVWDAQVYDFDWWGIPLGAKHADAAEKFIVSASQAQSYANLTKYIPYASPRKDTIPLVAKDRLADLPTTPATSGVRCRSMRVSGPITPTPSTNASRSG